MTIYVLTHKKIDSLNDRIYVPLHVGRALGADFGYLGDNTGENISDLNPFFGELTGIYWAWQNDTASDYIGFAHYRRFYLNDRNDIMSEEDFIKILSEYDCITSDVAFTQSTNYENYSKTHPHKDLDEVEKSLKRLYPEYSTSYDKYMSDKGSCYSNLCVMRRDHFHDYASWLFSILFDASENINVDDYDMYQKRVYGFLSEMLLDVYVRHNNFNVYRCPIGTFGDKAETKELISAVGVLIKQGQIKEARSLCEQIVNMRPDITLPMSDSRHRIPILEHITCILDLEKDAGIRGLIDFSSDVNKLIDHYRNVHLILEKAPKISKDDLILLKNSQFSPFAAWVMITNDIARGIRQNQIDKVSAEKLLTQVLEPSDYELYKKLSGI